MTITTSPPDPRGRIYVSINGAPAGYVRAERGGTWIAAPEVRADGRAVWLAIVQGLASREAAVARIVAEVEKYGPPVGGGR